MTKENFTLLNPPIPMTPQSYLQHAMRSIMAAAGESTSISHNVHHAMKGITGNRASFMILDDIVHNGKFAPVCPPRIYQAMREGGYLPRNVLLLAHDVAANRDLYEAEFNRAEWQLNTNIIMDNSLIETGGAVDAEMVYRAANIVNADIVVLPDVLRDGKASTEATLKAWPEWFWKFRDFDKMVVIQGANVDGWFSSAETLYRELGNEPDWLSVPRVAEGILDHDFRDAYHRSDLVQWTQMIWGEKPVHLLGFSDYITRDIEAACHPAVRSIDSAVPLRCATLGIKNILSGDVGKRGTWWDDAAYLPEMIDNCLYIDQLINANR